MFLRKKRELGTDAILGHMTTAPGASPVDLVHPREARAMHTYVCGNSGTGKSRFLEHIVRQHILTWPKHQCGMLMIDPHGNMYDNVMAYAARCDLRRPIIPIDLRRDDFITGYNLLRHRGNASPSVVIDAMIMAMMHVWGAGDADQTPRLARWAANVFTTLYEKGLTLPFALPLLGNRVIRAQITADLKDRLAESHWRRVEELPAKEYEAQIESLLNRLQRFLRNELLMLMFSQSKKSLNMREVIDNGSIVLVSASSERALQSEESADMFCTLLLTDLWTCAQQRGKNDSNKPIYVVLDEFHRFITPSISDSLDMARGFGIHMLMASQYPGQLSDRGNHGIRLRNSVMENASSKICFRLSDEPNLDPMARWLYRSTFDDCEIKHELYSTKVLNYTEEKRYTRSTTNQTSRGTSSSRGKSTATGATDGESEGNSKSLGKTQPQWQIEEELENQATISDQAGEQRGASRSKSRQESESETNGESEQTSESETIGEQTVLIPHLGKELSSVQFRTIQEQLERAKAWISEQPRRHAIARLAGMKTPVRIEVPLLKNIASSPKEVERYYQRLQRRLNFAVPRILAVQQLEEQQKLLEDLQTSFDDGSEPDNIRRQIE